MQRSGVRPPSTPPLPRSRAPARRRRAAAASRVHGAEGGRKSTMVRRLYTPELANLSLPLVQRIAQDVQATARQIEAVRRDLARGGGDRREREDHLAALADRFGDLVGELEQLGVELKDPLTGLLDFRARRGDVEVYLCWRLGE